MSVEDSETNATKVLVFMLSSLKKSWKWPIGYFFVYKVKSTVQSQLIKFALIECEKFNLKVLSATCDGAYVNTSTLNILGCDINQNYDSIKCSFKVVPTSPTIYYTPDACHSVKLARNALGEYKTFKDENGDFIKWKYVTQFFKVQSDIGFKMGNKIGSSHIKWKANIMKVKLAVQTLSSSVADALQFLQKTSTDFKNCNATIKFIRVIDELFDFLNAFSKGLKQPITLNDIEYLGKRMTNNIKYLCTV